MSGLLEKRLARIEETLDAAKGVRIIWGDPSTASAEDRRLAEDLEKQGVRVLWIHWRKKNKGTAGA